MLRPVLLALLAAASASAQPTGNADSVLTGARAEAVAYPLFLDLLDAERAHLADATALALSGSEGALYLRVQPGGTVECAVAFRSEMLQGFGEMFCLSPAVLASPNDEGDDFEAFDITVRDALWEGETAQVIGVSGIEDADGMESMEMWVARAPLRLVRLRAMGELAPQMPMEVEVDRSDFREIEGVLLPHRYRLTWADPSVLLTGSGVTPEAFLAELQALAEAKPSAESAALVSFGKAVAAGTPYVLTFVVDRVEVDGPLPAGLFDGEDGRAE